MVLLLILAQNAAQSAEPKPVSPARVQIRIERGVKASATEWRSSSGPRRREIRRIDQNGRTELIRVVEFE